MAGSLLLSFWSASHASTSQSSSDRRSGLEYSSCPVVRLRGIPQKARELDLGVMQRWGKQDSIAGIQDGSALQLHQLPVETKQTYSQFCRLKFAFAPLLLHTPYLEQEFTLALFRKQRGVLVGQPVLKPFL